ncbi:MAG: hypothetical protein ACTHW1_02715 [Ancrocorticia sp.]|uniref:hypothetical protein n=1 Tax=Ancrocorticia sp. TaxID=2593684 RepID=UPI003F8DFDF3
MSTNTPPSGFGQQPQQPSQGSGFPQGQQPGIPPFQSGPMNPATKNPQKERLTNLAMCGVPLLIAFIALFLPYFTVSAGGYSESVSWAQGDSGGPFIIALIFILVAIIPLVLQFIPKANVKQLASSSSLVGVAGVILIVNVIFNWNPRDVSDEDLSYYGVEVSRGFGFWLLLICGVALIATGALFTRWATKQAKLAQPGQPGHPGQPQPGQPGQPRPGQNLQGGPAYPPYPGPQAPSGQGAPNGQPFGGQPFGGQPGGDVPGQPFGAPQPGAQPPAGTPFGGPQNPQTPPPAASPDGQENGQNF